jgi:hypothetical protein
MKAARMTMNRLIIAAASGLLALFSMYWDDSIHTDVARDTFWSAPHMLLHGSLPVTLAATAWWGIGRILGQGIRAAAAVGGRVRRIHRHLGSGGWRPGTPPSAATRCQNGGHDTARRGMATPMKPTRTASGAEAIGRIKPVKTFPRRARTAPRRSLFTTPPRSSVSA